MPDHHEMGKMWREALTYTYFREERATCLIALFVVIFTRNLITTNKTLREQLLRKYLEFELLLGSKP